MNALEQLYVVWQDPKSRKYFPVGRLRHISEGGEDYFEFVYIRGTEDARQHSFEPFLAFPELRVAYRSTELFPFFVNRLLLESREKEYKEFVRSLGLVPGKASPIEILARSGGRRATDSIELFAPFENGRTAESEECLINYFFLVHGLRHMRDYAQRLANTLKRGDPLFIMHDLQNPVDPEAMVLRTSDYCCVGFLPRYLLADLWELVKTEGSIKVSIERLNASPAPIQQRILCKLQTAKREGFEPCSSDIYLPLSSESS